MSYDVARCWEYVSTDRLLGIVQARVVHVTVAGEHSPYRERQ